VDHLGILKVALGRLGTTVGITMQALDDLRRQQKAAQDDQLGHPLSGQQLKRLLPTLGGQRSARRLDLMPALALVGV
jgi:hypothetical protein